MSIPNTLEASHAALLARYQENEPVIRSLCEALREDIIPNVLDEMSEEGAECDVEDLKEWASDAGADIISFNPGHQDHDFPQDQSSVLSRFVPFDRVGSRSCLYSATSTQLPLLFKLFASHLYGG